MELENILAGEIARVTAVAEAVSGEIARPRAWWVRALSFLRGMVL